MATGRDTLRIVTLSAGGRPVQVLDLNDASGYWRDREAGFQFTPAAVSQQVSRRAQRFGGGRVVGEIHDNGSIGWTAYVRGSTVAECSQRAEALISQIHETARGRYLEWAPDTLSSSFLELAGPGSWTPSYDPLMLSQSQAMKVQISFPVLPLVRWAPMTIGDTFDESTLGDYTFDAATSADVTLTGVGSLQPVVGAALTSERRTRHTTRGYPLFEGQATLQSTPGTTITGYKAAVVLRGSNSTNYVEVYVDDNGTNSRLRTDVILGGTRTNRSSSNLAARVSSGTTFWVRGRIEGQAVIAEYFSAAPTPMGTPTLTNSYTLAVGEQGFLGYAGWSWVPQHASARLDNFEFRPFTRRNLALPQVITQLDSIPGGAPALATVKVTPLGVGVPQWAMLAWEKLDSGTVPPFGIFEEADSSVALSGGWTSSAQAGARGGFDARVTTAGAFTGVFTISLTAAVMEADGFADGTLDVEVWARMLISSTLVSPTARLSVSGKLPAGGSFAAQNSVEYGSTGKLLVKPSSGTVYRFVRLGIVPVDISAGQLLAITGTTAVGSTGVFGIDYAMVVPARRRALGATGVAASTITPFVPDNATEWSKQVFEDLHSDIQAESFATSPNQHVGLGGSLIHPTPGANRWLVKLSSLVPDDPTSDATTEQLAQAATVSVDITPRSFMLRSA
jgi:hypothetical protein